MLSVKFRWIPFNGFRGEVENVSANQRPGRPSCFSDRLEKHKLGRGRWDLAFCQVSLNSVQWFQRRSRKCESLRRTTDGRRTDGRTDGRLRWAFGSGELKKGGASGFTRERGNLWRKAWEFVKKNPPHPLLLTDRQQWWNKYTYTTLLAGVYKLIFKGKKLLNNDPWKSKLHGGGHFFKTFCSKSNVNILPMSAFSVAKWPGESFLSLKNDPGSHFSTESLFNATTARISLLYCCKPSFSGDAKINTSSQQRKLTLSWRFK